MKFQSDLADIKFADLIIDRIFHIAPMLELDVQADRVLRNLVTRQIDTLLNYTSQSSLDLSGGLSIPATRDVRRCTGAIQGYKKVTRDYARLIKRPGEKRSLRKKYNGVEKLSLLPDLAMELRDKTTALVYFVYEQLPPSDRYHHWAGRALDALRDLPYSRNERKPLVSTQRPRLRGVKDHRLTTVVPPHIGE